MNVEAKIKEFHDAKAATADLVPVEQMERMRVLWKKGINMFASFLTEAETIKRQIGDDKAFASWCYFHLGIGASRISDAAVVLKREDAERVRNEFADAKQAEKEKLAAEAHERKKAQIARENELAAERAKNAERKVEEAKKDAEAKKLQKRVENKKRRAEKAAAQGDSVSGPTTMMQAREIVRPLVEGKATVNSRKLQAEHSISHVTFEAATAAERARLEALAEGASEAALYDQYVIEGKTAANHQWTLGDLAIKVCALRRYGEKTLERYAYDIGVEYGTLKTYMAAAKAWKEKAVRPAFFSIGYILINHPDRVAIIHNDPHTTVEEAQEIMRAYKATLNVVSIKEAK